jgi:Xaa-Pro aminopeptidase
MGTGKGPDFAARRKRLKRLMKGEGLDAIITSDAKDVFYYTGYEGMKEDRISMIFPADGKPKLLVSSLENDAEEKYPRVAYIKEKKDFIGHLRPYGRLGYDERSLNLLLFQEIRKSLKAKLQPSAKIMELPRIEKDAHEIEQIRQAVKLTGTVLQKIGGFLWGNAEKRIADSVEVEFRRRGSSESFETIVCAGRHTAFVHHKPDLTIAKAKLPVLIDTGCVVNGYCSDITRMFFGRLAPRQRKVYEDVKHIHDELIGSIRAGVAYKELDELQKKLFAKSGYEVIHGFGHGIGLSVHESAGETLKENAILTVEPGVYLKGIGGFRVEDMILVKKNKAEVLSRSIPVL